MSKKNYVMFLNSWFQIILSLEEKNDSLAQISKKSGIQYSHVIKIIKCLKNKKIVVCCMKGREQKIWLTEKGIKLKKLLEEVRGMII